MPKFRILLLLLFLMLVGCKKCPDRVPPFTWHEFTGREERVGETKLVRRPTYRAKVPVRWKRITPGEEVSLLDTKTPLVTFLITDNTKLTLHSFPADTLEERIPPSAQVNRWKSQLGAEFFEVEPLSYGGFGGLFFHGSNGNTSCLAWSMQLDLAHLQNLLFRASNLEEKEHYRQMGADYTIKVQGPPDEIAEHKEEILFFAESFGLIQPLPSPL
ncbi:MAG: hypothetical protein K940chlam9_00978 [Chlamydiae bacterium]|nr:hypothetical protein [Chlamydiota bacterium]